MFAARSVRSDHSQIPIYFLFTLAVVAYNFLFLKYGYNATDEGYLLTMGQRIVDGERPYFDFFYLRTPLSIYIQAAFIKIFGDGYTILFSRVVWAFQMWLMAVMVSFLYRKLVNRIEFLLLILTTYVISSMLISFPWYNYDCVFFAILALVLYTKDRYILCGLAAFLSFFCKQNYLALLPLFVVMAAIVNHKVMDIPSFNRRSVLRILTGFVIPAAIYMIYLLASGTLSAFFRNVFILPVECSEVSIWFTLFQNNHIAFLIAFPLIVTAVLLFHLRNPRWLVLVAPGATAAIYIMLKSEENFAYAIAFLNYSIMVLLVIRVKITGKDQLHNEFKLLFTTLIFLIAIQYLSGFTYSGALFTYIGAGAALPIAYLLFREMSPSPHRKTVAYILFGSLLFIGAYHKYTYIYWDDTRSNLTAEFESGKLKGIRSTPRNVQQITDLIKATEYYTKKGDYVLAYPDFPVLYYLTGRRNPTPIPWYYRFEFNLAMLPQSIEIVQKKIPKVIFVQKYVEWDYLRKGNTCQYMGINRYAPLFYYISMNYDMLRPVGDIFIFVPKV